MCFLPSAVSVSPSPARTHFHPSINAHYSIRRTCRIRSHLTRLDQIWTEVCLGFPLRMMKIWMQESHPCNATSAPTHTRTRNNRKRRGLVVTLKISQGRHCRVLAAKRASEHFHHYIIQEKDRAHWTNVSGTTRGKLSHWNPPLNKLLYLNSKCVIIQKHGKHYFGNQILHWINKYNIYINNTFVL